MRKIANKIGIDFFWHEIINLETAQKAAIEGCYAAGFIAIFTVVLALLGFFGIHFFSSGYNLWALVDATIFVIIAWKIYKMSRAAAIVGLILYFFERIFFVMSESGNSWGIIAMTLIFSLMFINSVRGTFAYHKFIKK